MATYASAFVRDGRVYAPLDPLVLRVADRVWFVDGGLVVERAGRRIRVPLPPGFTEELAVGYVPVAAILRGIGERVVYDSALRQLDVRSPAGVAPAMTPTPYRAGEQVPPRVVFTPQPVPTPRPVWTGVPLPRRTPLPGPGIRRR